MLFFEIYVITHSKAIATELIEDMDISLAEFGLLYSVYSIPNMVMVFFGGVLLDKLGLRPGILKFLLQS
jgi:MFS family permease